MRKQYRAALKKFFRVQLIQTRDTLHLTQAQMAKVLFIEERSYAALESGKSCCGALTLALFLIYCCQDPALFLKNLREVLEKEKRDAA